MSVIAPLPWQHELWTQLSASAREDRLSHALLLAGPGGIGKRHFARALANALLCESRQADGLACGRCRSCLQLAAGSHPNLFWLKPDVDDKTGKEKRDIGIEQIRVLGEKLALSGHYGQGRVAVIEPADALNTNGVNALLKTIEEPPPGSHLLLISERPMALAATLRSRCVRLRFSPPSREDAIAWLKAEHPQVPAAALDAANGAPLAALALHESGALELHAQWRDTLLKIAAQKQDPVAAAATVGKEQAAAWLEWLLTWLSLLLRQRLTAGQGVEADIARRAHAVGLEQMLNETTEGLRRLRQNANPQLTIESLMILWWHSARVRRAGA